MALLNSYQQLSIEAGCDEAGRGCYAGPVVAAAVILPRTFFHPLLNDSKKLSPANRAIMREIILENALCFGIGWVSNEEIDVINILQASFKAMHLAIQQLTTKPELLAIDGNRFNPYPGIPHICLIKGDANYANIAAASILAKTERDMYMEQLHQQYPEYDWKQNKGYGTKTHRDAIAKWGLTPYHRKSFNILDKQLNLFSNNPAEE